MGSFDDGLPILMRIIATASSEDRKPPLRASSLKVVCVSKFDPFHVRGTIRALCSVFSDHFEVSVWW
jgi:hypothetical protein